MKKCRSNLCILFYLLIVCQLGTSLYSMTSDKIFSVEKDKDLSDSIVGIHAIADFSDCSVPEDPSELEKILRAAAKASGNTDLEFTAHKFHPFGISAVLILAESHISVHSWPEKKYAAIDAFTCGKTNPREALEYLRKAFNAGSVKITVIKRGQD